MTSGSPSSGEANAPGRRRRTVDAGLATIVAACILAGGGVGGGFIGRATASGTTLTSTTPKATPAPASVTIAPPTTGDIPYYSTLSGRVYNLQRGQLVWTFFQLVSVDGSLGSQTYPTNGPCTVNYASQTWICPNAYIGKETDNEIYRVCAAILNFSEAFAVVKLIENTYASNNLPYWFASPPPYIQDNPAACMSVHRT